MAFQKEWTGTRKKEPSNKMRRKPTISFRANLSPEVLGYINNLAGKKAKSKFIIQSIESRYFYMFNKRVFLKQVLEYEYDLARFLLRKIGGRNKTG